MQHAFIKIIIFSFIIILLPWAGEAATLSFSPSDGAIGPGSTMAVDVLLDVSECVNAIEADISFPNDYMQLSDFIIGESILPLWVKKPDDNDIKEANENGIINFIGGIPGGYCGKIPGDSGKSNMLARMIFKVPSLIVADENKSRLDLSFLSTTKVLLNDGFGTADMLTAKSASFIYQNTEVEIDDTWSKELNADNIAPEPFIIELMRKKDVFDNQYYIIFNTIDKQSGMDHYEILEIRKDEEQGVTKNPSLWDKISGKKQISAEWKIGTMPYLLSDQDLLSTIRVKAVDKAGNERFVEYIPKEIRASAKYKSLDWKLITLVIIGVLLISIMSFIIIKKIIIKKRYDKEQGD